MTSVHWLKHCIGSNIALLNLRLSVTKSLCCRALCISFTSLSSQPSIGQKEFGLTKSGKQSRSISNLDLSLLPNPHTLRVRESVDYRNQALNMDGYGIAKCLQWSTHSHALSYAVKTRSVEWSGTIRHLCGVEHYYRTQTSAVRKLV